MHDKDLSCYSEICPNYNMSDMEQMTHFIKGLNTNTRILLDASTGGSLRSKN